MKFRGIIFDMDGTLTDSREIILGAFKHVLEEFGQSYNEAIVQSTVGRLLEDTYETLLPVPDPKKAVQLHRSWQFDNQHLLKGFNGLDQFLKALKSLGFKLGIYTSAIRPRADLALDGLNIRQYFDGVVCGDDVKKPKPDKEGVVTCACLLGLKLTEVVMVGDAEHDITSGKQAGVVTIGVTHGFGTPKALREAGADYLVSNFKELLERLKFLNSNGS